ncbi:hypothetical protein [Advenella alkanexedens]|uniref:hypothetical protein n=1 Tax=Advenella alkanexedens TaxID=1481665 RepID=UPI002676E29F|nr:hypothetical protein [Advenella alkanexedens]WKU18320.1 hypothetical protein Q3V95_08290 [Advenella alkanexedens]
MIDLVLKIIPGILIATISLWLSTRWAIKKFYSEKWWYRKETAYSEIINALYDLILYFKVHKEDYGQGTGYSKEKEIELYQNYINSYWALKKAIAIGSFYISKKAQAILVNLDERDILDFHNNPSWDYYEKEFTDHQICLNELIIIAKLDLKEHKI